MKLKYLFILTFICLGLLLFNIMAIIDTIWWIVAGPLDFLVCMFIALVIYDAIKYEKDKPIDYRGTTDFHSWGRKQRFKK